MWELRVCVGGSGGLLARQSDREWISGGRIFLAEAGRVEAGLGEQWQQ